VRRVPWLPAARSGEASTYSGGLKRNGECDSDSGRDQMEVGEPRHLLHVGTALKIAKQQQIDFHVGVALSSAAMDHFVGVGYSFRFQAIRR
jgi:hypothetical protein